MPVEHRHYFDRIIRSRGRVCVPFQVLLHSPDMAERVAAVGEPILYDTLLPPPAKALTWLITAREFDCDYEWALAEHAAQRAGIPDALVRTIGRREPLTGLDDEQQVLADLCHQLLRGNHHVDDAIYRAAVAKFGVPGTVRVAATIGYFAMHAVVLNAFEVNPKGEKSEPML